MIYVFDSDSLIDLFKHYYLDRFPSLWNSFDELIISGSIVSVREVLREIEGYGDRLDSWTKNNREFFLSPSTEELNFVREIFDVHHFQSLIRKKEQLSGKPVADPFVITKAKALDGMVITQETKKPNAAKIPNVCDHFDIPHENLEGFMEKENWTF